MAIVRKLNQAILEAWIAERPPIIQEMIRRWPLDRLYRMERGEGHRATIHGYCEDGTVTVNVTGEFNAVLFGRKVFGIDPETLVECDLPGPEEPLGESLRTPEEVEAFLALHREAFLKKH